MGLEENREAPKTRWFIFFPEKLLSTFLYSFLFSLCPRRLADLYKWHKLTYRPSGFHSDLHKELPKEIGKNKENEVKIFFPGIPIRMLLIGWVPFLKVIAPCMGLSTRVSSRLFNRACEVTAPTLASPDVFNHPLLCMLSLLIIFLNKSVSFHFFLAWTLTDKGSYLKWFNIFSLLSLSPAKMTEDLVKW